MRHAIARLPEIRFAPHDNPTAPLQPESIQVVENVQTDEAMELQPQASQRPPRRIQDAAGGT
jgi:hypothetical protein